jgi:hypothetical protein
MKTAESNESSVGRPTKYNDKTIERLCEALADGMPIKSACIKAGIGVTTLNEWRDRYPHIETKIEQARDKFREKALQTIKAAFESGDWRAAVAALKLVFPEYRESTKVDVSAVAVSGPVLVEPERLKLIEARRQRALKALEAKQLTHNIHTDENE